ncbi:hypothetical protein SCLCIDRAFT_23703 [Scleroderma citrinum Foug A]|uniref:Uncharacterized protein n=1 Tax=Scleroderma citrinum Foug A TaxID=1036808 RepID=A0A0C2ZR87_9AGAM|nr:hypothetical protein SCLCIDRAFT_23703 [Scleroderma citrinum Foug A]
MVFFKSLFRNPPDIEDESYALDSLEKGTSTMDSLSAYATPVPDINATPMDTNDTTLTLTVPLADNMPGSLCLLPSSGSSKPTSGEIAKTGSPQVLLGGPGGQGTRVETLEAHMKNKDVIIVEQAQLLSQLRNDLEEVKRQTATQSSALAQIGSKDAIIMQQLETLEKLQRAVLEAKMEIQ